MPQPSEHTLTETDTHTHTLTHTNTKYTSTQTHMRTSTLALKHTSGHADTIKAFVQGQDEIISDLP